MSNEAPRVYDRQKMMKPDLEFAIQAQNLVDLRYPRALDMSEKKYLASLPKAPRVELESETLLILVDPRVSEDEQRHSMDVIIAMGGEAWGLDDLRGFGKVNDVVFPYKMPYWINVRLNRLQRSNTFENPEWINKRLTTSGGYVNAEDCIKDLPLDERGLTIIEGLALVREKPLLFLDQGIPHSILLAGTHVVRNRHGKKTAEVCSLGYVDTGRPDDGIQLRDATRWEYPEDEGEKLFLPSVIKKFTPSEQTA